MRAKIVAGNWKMNKTLEEGLQLLDEILMNEELNRSEAVLKIIAPPFIHLASFVSKQDPGNNFFIAAQNCHQEESGAYTGEVSAKMIASTGASYVIIGHSERRQYFAESNQLLSQKVNAALKNDLSVIFCIGEKLEERKDRRHFEVIKKQLIESLFHLSASEFSKIIIAYEPVWAIGTGVTATTEQAREMHNYIRNLLKEKYSNDLANSTSILYGGSCNAGNARELFACEDIDGGLIGGASLKAQDFVKIINSFQ